MTEYYRPIRRCGPCGWVKDLLCGKELEVVDVPDWKPEEPELTEGEQMSKDIDSLIKETGVLAAKADQIIAELNSKLLDWRFIQLHTGDETLLIANMGATKRALQRYVSELRDKVKTLQSLQSALDFKGKNTDKMVNEISKTLKELDKEIEDSKRKYVE